jgi:hypothetical protein
METNEAFHAQLTGSLLAVRLVIAALIRSHPAPEELLREIKAQMDTRAELDKRLAEPAEAALDGLLHEFTSQLYARINRQG